MGKVTGGQLLTCRLAYEGTTTLGRVGLYGVLSGCTFTGLGFSDTEKNGEVVLPFAFADKIFSDHISHCGSPVHLTLLRRQ
jgi:hypothetical protein